MRGLWSLALAATLGGPAWAQIRAQLSPLEETQIQLNIQRETKEYKPAKAYVNDTLENTGESYYSLSGYGDVVLENEMARFVFGAAPANGPRRDKSGNLFLQRGSLIDAGTDPSAPEALNKFAPSLAGIGAVRVEVDSIEPHTDPDGKATVVVNAFDALHPELKVRTEYLMYRDMPGVLVTTSLTNTSAKDKATDVTPSDIVLWGSMIPFVPGKGWINGSHIGKGVEFVFGRFDSQWMLIAPETGYFDVAVAGEAMGLSYGQSIDMEPGETRLYRRWVLVSERDPAFLYSLVQQKRPNSDFGTLVGRAIEREQASDGTMVDRAPVTDAEIFITPYVRPDFSPDQAGQIMGKPYLIAKTQSHGEFETFLPPGEYHVYPSTESRLAPKPNFAQLIQKGKVDGLDFGTSRSARLIYKIVDDATGEPIPGKLTVEALRGTREVRFGNFGDLRAGNVIYSPAGAGMVDIPSGNYRIVASRGIEYEMAEERVDIKPIRDTEQVFRLKRAFDTPGWISADIGVRTNATPTSRVLPEVRVATAAAEGVEWLVSGDSNVATDLKPAIKNMGLTGFVNASPGFRRSGKTAPFIGDFLVFPTDICSTGATPDFSPVMNALKPEDVVKQMRALCPEAVVMLTRASWPQTGYLTRMGYDEKTGRLPIGDYTLDFDAFQIWEGKRQGVVRTDYRTFHTILRTGYKMAALAGSNAGGTWTSEVGYPRVYIKSSTDDPAKIDPAELARNIKNGLASVTNGPFISMTVNGQPAGSTVTDTDGLVDLDLKIYAPNFAKINSVRISLNGEMTRQVLLNSKLLDYDAGLVFPPKDKPEDGKLPIRISGDAILDVLVEGSMDDPMNPVNPFLPFSRDSGLPNGQWPMALSAPVFIDTDGNGKMDIEKLEKIPVFRSTEPDMPF